MSDEGAPFEHRTADGGAARDAGGWFGDPPVAPVDVSADGTVVRRKPSARELPGCAPREVRGRHIVTPLRPGAARSLGRWLWETAATGRGVRGTVIAWHRVAARWNWIVPAGPSGTAQPAVSVVLYTDDLVEARGTDIAERPAELAHCSAGRGPHVPVRHDRLITHLVPGSADDDIALLVARIGTRDRALRSARHPARP